MKHPDKELIAHAATMINASTTEVWEALMNPAMIKQYMFGTNVVTNWREGSPIIWQGEWQGKAYEDKGTILKIKPEQLLQYSHFSQLSGRLDLPENYHTVTIELAEVGGQTAVSLTQDNNENEETRQHATQNWQMMLESLKQLLES